MTDFLRNRFPLADTSTVYMNGMAAYNLVSMTQPGVIAHVTMLPHAAERFRVAVREAMEIAWEEGAEFAWQTTGEGFNAEWPGDDGTDAWRKHMPDAENPYEEEK